MSSTLSTDGMRWYTILPMSKRVIDAQLHVWPPDTPEHPWQPGVRTPSRGEFSCRDALELLDGAGVDTAILIPPIWNRFDEGYVLGGVAAYPGRFAVVAWFDPTGADLARRFGEVTGRSGVVGVRLLLTVPPGNSWVRDGHIAGGSLGALWPVAEAAGVPLVIRLTARVAELGRVASRHPTLTLVIDHAAAESEPGERAFDALPDLVELARFENVYVKLSSLAKYSTAPSPYADMDPVVKQVVDAFGADRCMWGSDFTQYWDRCEYDLAVDQFRSGCPFLGDRERAAILGGTAERVFRLDG